MNKKLKYGLLGAMFTAITFVIPVADAASGVGQDTSNLREATPEVVTERSSTVPVLDMAVVDITNLWEYNYIIILKFNPLEHYYSECSPEYETWLSGNLERVSVLCIINIILAIISILIKNTNENNTSKIPYV